MNVDCVDRRPGARGHTSRRPVAMLTHSYYEEDARVRREAEALVARGRPVDVFALRRPDDPPDGELDGVHVYRLDVQRHQGAGVGTYLREYLDFFGRAAVSLTRAQPRRHYAVVQVHTMPDFLVFAGLPLRMVGVPLLLDLHEAMPVFFPTRFPRAANPIARAALDVQERLAVSVASRVIIVNEALRDRLVEQGARPTKIVVVPNHPSLARFDPTAHPARPFMTDGTLRLVYAGALTPVYELEVAVDAVLRLGKLRPGLDVRLEILGRGDRMAALARQIAESGLAERVMLRGRIPFEDVPGGIAAADIGLAPTRLDDYTKYSLSTKLFEYGAMRRPVVASRLPLVERTFPDATVLTYAPGDAGDLAQAILHLVDRPADREARVAATATFVSAHSWEREAERYAALIEDLAADGLSSEPSVTSNLEDA